MIFFKVLETRQCNILQHDQLASMRDTNVVSNVFNPKLNNSTSIQHDDK